MKKIIYFLLIIISSSIIAKETDTILYVKDDYQISLPVSWYELPDESVEVYSHQVSYNSGNRIKFSQVYYDNEKDTSLITVIINRVGKIPESEFSNYKEIKKGYERGKIKYQRKHGSASFEVTPSEPYYDPDAKILWSEFRRVEGTQTIKFMSALLLTEFGYVIFSLNTLEEDFAKDSNVFMNMIDSIVLEDKDVYLN